MLKYKIGEKIMSRKNNMRTPEEKEKIILEYYSGNIGRNEICRKYEITTEVFRRWRIKYDKYGIKGLKSQTGKTSHNNPNAGLHLRKPKNKIEELQIELMKKDIEIARLKKGYVVKGVGQEKEFVTTFNKNTK